MKNKWKRKRKSKACVVCGEMFTPYSSLHKYCSSKCSYKGKPVKTKKKGPTETAKRNYMDAMWAEIIKIRADYKCEYCGDPSRLNSHHIFSRKNYSTRWEVENGICLCSKHHILGNFSAHTAPLAFSEWLKERKGEKWYDKLMLQFHNTDKIDKAVKLEELKKVKKELEGLL